MSHIPDNQREDLPPYRFGNLIRSDFWFNDGNIVIITSSAAFKVHRGQLERQSEVFNDLFSIPQPPEQDLVQGCPFVELSDTPSDMFYFLGALYDGIYFKTPRSLDFSAIAAVLRLSTKYLVEHLRQRCLIRLEADWPSTLSAWDLREQKATDEHKRYAPRDWCSHPVLIIQLALDMNLPSLIPAALYDLSRYSPSKIMAGAPLPITIFERVLCKLTGSPMPLKKPVKLSRDLLCRIFRGRETTHRYMTNFIAQELHDRPPSPACLHQHDPERPSRDCRKSFYFIMLNILRSVGGIACGRDADPLYTLIQATDMLSRTDFSDGQHHCSLKLCQPCKIDFASAALKAREDFWQLLPRLFGLVEGDTDNSILDLD